MTEQEANNKLIFNEHEYFNRLFPDSRTKYIAVIKNSLNQDIKNDYIIEIGLSNFTYEYDYIKNNINKDLSNETKNDFLEQNIKPIVSEEFGLQADSIIGGSSVSYKGCLDKGGTLGALFKFKNSEHIFLISNRHVIFDTDYKDYKNLVVSPARIDVSNSLRDIRDIGKIIWASQKEDDKLDAAIAKLNSNAEKKVKTGKFTIDNSITFNGIEKPKIGDSIRKFGNRTKLTFGEIRSINCTVNVSKNINQPKVFRRQILTTNISKKGDSGSVIVNDNNNVVGLLTGGNESTASFCNNISFIFDCENGLISNFLKFV